ncbi:hypothetical protein BX666DRAFT_2021958 [Dichotomocladium elegans]|nr:hypothetical protein BX666DRAFT_2021958 [Dichotomocladium elegans]
MVSVRPRPLSIHSNSPSSLTPYYADPYHDQDELFHVRALLAQKESENSVLRRSLHELQNKADSYRDLHQTLRHRIWTLEAELDTLKRTHIIRAETTFRNTPTFSQPSSDRSSSSSNHIGVDDPCRHAEETYKAVVSQVGVGRKKSESLVLGIHDMVRAIEAELAYLETPPISSDDDNDDDGRDEYEEDSVINLSTSLEEDKTVACHSMTKECDVGQRPGSFQTMPAAALMAQEQAHAMSRQRSQSLIHPPKNVVPATRRDASAALTADTMPQLVAARMAAALNGTSSRRMPHCQTQSDPRRRKSAFLGSLTQSFVPQQQQKTNPTLSEKWKISSSRRP